MEQRMYSFLIINYAIKNVHFPESFRDINIARNRLIFEELFLFELALLSMKNNCYKFLRCTKIPKSNALIRSFVS